MNATAPDTRPDAPGFEPCYPIEGVVYRSTAEASAQLAQGNWLNTNIGETLRAAAREVPNKLAVASTDGTLNFAQLDERSESVAASLLALGLVPGDRVLFQLGSSREYFIAFYGCMKAGVVPVCTLPQFRSIEMLHFAERTSARAFFVQADINPQFNQVSFAQDIAKSSRTVEHVIVVRGKREGLADLETLSTAFSLDEARQRTRKVAPSMLDVAVFQLSGGSTNLPKIIPRMHGEYLGATHQLSERYGLTEDDVALWSLPLVHNAGTLFMVLPVTLERRTLVIQPKVDIPEMLQLVARYGVTFSGSIGPVAPKLLEMRDLRNYDIRSLKQFFALSAAQAIENHVGVPVGQMFGMTEGMVFAASPTSPTAIRHATVGYPVSPGDQVKLLVPGQETEVGFGEVGELCFRGPNTLTGYFGDSEATRSSFTSTCFFRSGDLMRAHEIAGHVCYSFEGRIKDNINRGGEKIGAEEVEGLIRRHPDVADACVVAMPDPVYGEKVCAYLVLHIDRLCPTVPELGTFLLGQGIAKYKLPERIENIDAFPLTKVGKVDKARLRSMVAANLAGRANEP